MKKLAVITPCYNSEQWIGECVESVSKSVTFDKFLLEHIIIDDGSTDGSLTILKRMMRPGLRVHHLEINGGPSVARNKGLELAGEADKVFFLDADDVIFQNSLRYLWEQDEEWAYGDFLRADKDLIYRIGEDYYGWKYDSGSDLLYSIFTGRHFFQENSMFTIDMINKAGGFDESRAMAEDLDLAIRLLLAGWVPKFVPGPLYFHRYHEHNLSENMQSHPEKHKRDLQILFNNYKSEIGSLLSSAQIKEVEGYVES